MLLLVLTVLMLLVKLMLKVLSMPKLHSSSGVHSRHASADCLPLLYMPTGAHHAEGDPPVESLVCRSLYYERDAPQQP